MRIAYQNSINGAIFSAHSVSQCTAFRIGFRGVWSYFYERFVTVFLMHEYIGAIHIHSVYSDGTGAIPEIARAASEVGLDFIMLSDHNTLKAKKDGWEGWHDGVAVLIGYEINDKNDRNHYLAFGLDSTVGVRISAQEYVRRVKEQGGIGFIAHPDEARCSMPEHPSYPWNAWDSNDFDGIEIWNHMSEWMEGLTEENKFQRFIHPLRSIKAPPQITLKRWDELNKTRRVVGVGGVDAHAHKADVMGFFNVEVFPYKVIFKSVHTHVLLDAPLKKSATHSFDEDKWNIYNALRDGRAFIANDYHGDSRGFTFHATHGRKRYLVGSEITLNARETVRFTVETPLESDLRLLRNGEIVEQAHAASLTHRTGIEGAYRVEAWIRDKGWIFSNHIRVKKEKKTP